METEIHHRYFVNKKVYTGCFKIKPALNGW